jgi:acyl carrier protein
VTSDEMLDELQQFIVEELLDGRSAGFNAHTPLLEWRVIDSLSLQALLSFTHERIGIEVPQEHVTPENLKDLSAYVAMLERVAVADRA